ncbi:MULTISPECIES: hypothetical protein [unclassified Marinobacter]|uniref:hypothetical protein n=1 Tax=unclassified Marinobacter TaxID=83889 RepID=UPI0019084881|nr:hypothetical protein [Marinobacter sp. DY40_1A1]MBK1886297.1 hypothetical protein [Marinobacter sp. DY40_1A1]
MKSDGVSAAFALILDEIEAVEVQLNREGAIAFGKSQYDDAAAISSSGKKLEEFRSKLEKLHSEWSSGIDVKTRERVKIEPGYSLKPHSKGARTALRVTLANGCVIQSNTAAQTMADTIEYFGVENVRALQFTVNGIELVSTSKHPKYGQTRVGNFFICTHSNTESKKKMLERLAIKLNRPLTVEVV